MSAPGTGRGSLGACPSQGRGKDAPAPVDSQIVNFGQRALVNDEGLALGRDAVDQTVWDAAGEHVTLRVNPQAHNVRLLAVKEHLTLARLVHAKDLPFISGADVQPPLCVKLQGPDVLGLGIVKHRRFTLGSDFIDFALRRAARIQIPVRTDGQGENIRFVRRQQQCGLLVGTHAKDFALMPRADIQVSVRVARQRQGKSFLGTEQGLRIRRQRQSAFFAQRHSGKRALEEFVKRADLPEGGFDTEGR